MTAHPAVREGARRQPRRDRGPDLQDAARAGHRDRRCLLRRRSRPPPRRDGRRGLLIGAGPRESYLRGDVIVETARPSGRRGSASGLRLSRRERRVCPSGRATPVWSGSGRRPLRSKRWAPRSPLAGGWMLPVSRSSRGRRSRSSRSSELRVVAGEIGYPLAIKASAGGGGKGLKIVGAEPELERAYDSARREGEAYFADAHGVRRALHRGSPARRGTGARRCARERRPPRRAGLHDPAPASEAGRGDAVAGRRRRAAGADRRHRGRGGKGGGVSLCGNRGRAAHRRGRVLLPRDEHPHPGRAHGDGAGDRARSRPRAGAHRGGRGARVRAGRRHPPRARDRVPDQCRGRRAGASSPRPGGSRPIGSPAARG